MDPANAYQSDQKSGDVQHKVKRFPIEYLFLFSQRARHSYTRTFEEPIPDSACKRHAVSKSGFRCVSKPMVIIIQPAEQPCLTLLQGLLPTPYVDQGVRLVVVETVVRATVERHQQQGTRLFGTDDRQQTLNHPEHLPEMLTVVQNGIGRQQQGIQFATHHVALELQAAVLLQHLRGQSPILLRHPLRRVVPPERLVKPRWDAIAVQPGVDVAVLGIQRNDLILSGLDREQRDIHAVLDADHHLLASGAGLNDDRGLDPLELPLGDADTVALHQPVGAGRVDRQHVGVGLGHPAQVAHRLVRKVGIVLTVGVADARQEVVLGKETLHPVDLAFGSMDEDIVVEQRMVRADQLAVAFTHLDVRRGKELEECLPPRMRRSSSACKARAGFP